MNLHTLSSTLIGLEEQAMSYRRDIEDRDYPTDFYEKLVNPEEAWLDRHQHALERPELRAAQKQLSTHVKMERTYLNAWQTFAKRTENVPETISRLLKNKCTTLEDLFTALRALNACRFQAPELRDKIGKKFAKMR
mgnify:CR=1 FL=1